MSDDQRNPMHDEIELRTSRSDGEVEVSTVSEPMRLVRVGNMLGAMRAELRELDSDSIDRDRLDSVHRSARESLAQTLSGPLADELDAMVPTLPDEPTAGELRVAQAQLLGWLEGLLHGIQTALAYQQQSSAGQLDALKRHDGEGGAAMSSNAGDGPGQYL